MSAECSAKGSLARDGKAYRSQRYSSHSRFHDKTLLAERNMRIKKMEERARLLVSPSRKEGSSSGGARPELEVQPVHREKRRNNAAFRKVSIPQRASWGTQEARESLNYRISLLSAVFLCSQSMSIEADPRTLLIVRNT
jgi:hypothetical protein